MTEVKVYLVTTWDLSQCLSFTPEKRDTERKAVSLADSLFPGEKIEKNFLDSAALHAL